MKSSFNRRKLLEKSIKTAVVTAGALAGGGQVLAQSCRLTIAQPEGPFYPINDQIDKDSDLTYVTDKEKRALGEVVILKGIVKDQNCLPVKNALVEIWQACASGKYNHPGDPNTAQLDANFQYWGRAITNEKGEYLFKTIKPGAYPAGNGWVRPPHIHMKVHLRGHEEITTQVYFKEDLELNRRDRILASLPRQDRNNVIVHFQEHPQNPRTGSFDIVLRSL